MNDLARFVPYRTTEDRIDGAVLSFIDITRRRQAEDKLREGERRMRIVAGGTKDYAIITFDDEGYVTRWNASAELIARVPETRQSLNPTRAAHTRRRGNAGSQVTSV